MAYVNVAEWSPDQVTEWLKGLDNVILPYINSFLNNEVRGQQLLNLRSDDLEHLGVYTLGHQELILEAVEHLRNFHYELDRENLQFLALKLSCAANSLYNELLPLEDTNKVETQTMSDVATIISAVKPLVCWLDRSPFSGQTEYTDRKTELLRLSVEMATCAHRERFAERPVAEIRTSCHALAKLADNMIQEIADPLLLQPASLDLATLKKRENDLGFYIVSSFHPVHQIAEIKFGSPAHTSGKIEEGDEIVQVNYQTVVGWQRKKVLLLFQESPPDILLTLKKRPRHTKIYGQIYMKPYRLPSKKRALPYTRWHDNLPSPRPELLTIPDFEMPLPRAPPHGNVSPQMPPTCSSDSDSCGSVSDTEVGPQAGLCSRVYPLKPRPVLQRRNTITGASPTSKGPSASIEQFWRELKTQASYKYSGSSYIQSSTDNEINDSPYLRDKSASYGHGLELSPRPSTVIGLSQQSGKLTSSANKTIKSLKFQQNNKKICENETDKGAVVKRLAQKYLDNSENCLKDKKIGVRFEDENVEKQVGENRVEIVSNFTESVNRDCALHAKNEENLKFIDEYEDEVQDRSNLVAEEKLSESTNTSSSTDKSNLSAEWKNEIIEEIIGALKYKKDNVKRQQIDGRKVDLKEILTQSNEAVIKTVPKMRTVTNQKTDELIEIVNSDLCKVPKKIENSFESAKRLFEENNCKNVKKPPLIPPKPEIPKKPAIPPRHFDRKIISRGRLDKSHSTPAYDMTEGNVIAEAAFENGSYITDIKNVLKNKTETLTESVKKIEITNVIETRKTFSSIKIEKTTKVENTQNVTESLQTERRFENIRGSSSNVYGEAADSNIISINKNNIYEDTNCRIIKKLETFGGKSAKNTDMRQDPYEIYQIKSPYTEIQEVKITKSPSNLDVSSRAIDNITPTLTSEENFYGVHSETKTDGVPVPPPRPLCTLSSKQNFQPSINSTPKKSAEFDTCVTIPENKPNRLSMIEHDTSKGKCIDVKVNTTNAVVRAIISKGKTVKKKNSILSKRRKVSVKDVSPGEIQGFLYQRIRSKNNQTVNWAKRWFVLNGSALYGFKSKDATKADCLIFLSGFTVSTANEVKSRSNAFKVYHTGTVFYFSDDNSETMSAWMDLMTLATLLTETSLVKRSASDSSLFSETDESDADDDLKQLKSSDNKTETSRKFGSLKKFTSRKNSADSASSENSGSTSLDRKYLRFFQTHSNTKSNKNAQNLPVPTAQFRSYRKVVPPTAMNVSSQNVSQNTTSAFSNVFKFGSSKSTHETKQNQYPDVTVTNAPTTITSSDNTSIEDTPPKLAPKPPKMLQKPKPINYIHASNPSLCEIQDFKVQTFVPISKISHRNDNLAGFVTLKQFMLDRQEEERRQNQLFTQHNDTQSDKTAPSRKNSTDMSTNSDSKKLPVKSSQSEKSSCSSRKNSSEISEHRKLSVSHSAKSAYESISSDKNILCRKFSDSQNENSKHDNYLNEIQSRTLPKTPDRIPYPDRKMSTDSVFDYKSDCEMYGENVPPSKHEHKSSIFGSFKDRSYEKIFCTNQNRTLDNPKKINHPATPKHKNKIIRQRSLNSADKIEKPSIFKRGDSPEKFWLDSLRRNDKVTPKGDKVGKLKSATQYTPMCLPSNCDHKLNTKFTLELNFDEKNPPKSASSSKFKNFFGGNKHDNSASSEKVKEKTLLGSPRLHRAIFRRNSPQTVPSEILEYSTQAMSSSLVPPTSTFDPSSASNSISVPPPPDYPGLEYPPVFEPETYSLTNPACNLSFLRKGNSNNKMPPQSS